jgi:subfamily B ATP-binding cassette protein MsbA
MKKFKKFIIKNFSSFAYFYKYLGYKIFIAIGLSLLVGVLDGFGLTMFLPLLQMVNDAESVNPDNLGKLAFLIRGIEALGVNFNLVSVLLVMIVFFVLKGLSQFYSSAYRVILQQSFVKKMRLNLLNGLNQITYKQFVTSDIGRIQNTMTGEVEKVTIAFNFYFSTFQHFILVLVYMGFALFIDFQFAILVIIGGSLSNFLYKAIYNKTKGESRKLTTGTNLYQGQVIQHVGNYKYLKATGLLQNFSDKLRSTINTIETNRKKIGIYAAILGAAREPMLIIIIAVIIIFQTKVFGGSLGPILISLIFFYRALNALVQMQNAWNRYLENSGSMENVVSFEKELNEQPQKEGNFELKIFKNEISLKKLSFSYDDTLILNDINLEIKKNKSYAFVGESGSGKTTLVNLIAGLLQPTEGVIQIDKINYNKLVIKSLQNKLGYITQDPVIFNDSIYNNITFWSPKTEANLKRYQEALKKANLVDFVQTLPDKSETELGNSGVNISGGQKQRISVARELFKDIDILIMDEATSALDSKTEKNIQKSIDALKGEYTIIIIAHRLSTIRNCDNIVLLDKGKIKAQGNYKTLINKSTEFAEMINSQQL